MGVNWSLYNQKLTANGVTERDRIITVARRDFETVAPSNPGFEPNAMRNGMPQRLMINRKSGTPDYECLVAAFPGEEIRIGDLIEIGDKHWLVTSFRQGEKIQSCATMTLCNHKFRWLDFDKKVCECWGITNSPYSRYSRPESIVNTAYNVSQCLLPYNTDTNKLHIDKRFILWTGYDRDGNEIPYVYKITSVVKKNAEYGANNIISLDVERDVANANDSIAEMIADYDLGFTDSNVVGSGARAKIVGAGTVRMGASARVLNAEFYNSDGVRVNDISAVWAVTAQGGGALPDGITYEADGTTISLSTAANKSLLGEVIVITVTDNNELFAMAEKSVEVI